MVDLGKYAADVMLAYAVTIALIVGLILVSLRQSRKVKAALSEIEARRNG
ncbi:heme exporter protein CcmD [Nereida sp. MMG025]|nr:heme exporter protein CcmD [Nereida sp. MMG025]